VGADTGIAWTDHTFNPWWGCVRVSPGCEHCYAEAWDARFFPSLRVREGVAKNGAEHWGLKAPRRFFGDAHWNEPRKWNREAEKAGVRRRVFCASMADVFEDRRDLDEQRQRLWSLISETPHLDWQLLTKRPENIRKLIPSAWELVFPPNVWIGTTVEDQRRAAERIGWLLELPASVRFLSVEPLLERVNLRDVTVVDAEGNRPRVSVDVLTGHVAGPDDVLPQHIDWVIVGGESDQPGHPARPCALEWIEDVIGQCKAAQVPVFVKQLGSCVVSEARTADADYFSKPPAEMYRAPDGNFWAWRAGLVDRAGADLAAFPGFNVRQFPEVRK
jgi:protein gp37